MPSSQLQNLRLTGHEHSDIEQNRLDAQAAAIVEMIGGATCLAPFQSMPKVQKALDVGCGTGVATSQIANMFPSAKVYGLDISPVPEAVQVQGPVNAAWAVGNFLDFDPDQPDHTMNSEIFTSAGFDYIFGRMLFLGINDWSRYFSNAFRLLKSGSIIEHQDLDWDFYRVGTNECLSETWEWHTAVLLVAHRSGFSESAGSQSAALMRQAGFEIITVQVFEFSFVPSNKTPNSQAMGRYVQTKLLPQYPELLGRMLGSQGVTDKKLERWTEDSLHDLSSEEGIHQKYYVTIARKP